MSNDLKLSRRLVLGSGAAAILGSGRAVAADGPIKIGYVGPLSGSLSLLGISVRDGLALHVAASNEKGGIDGRKLELIAEDDGYDPARTVAAGKKLASKTRWSPSSLLPARLERPPCSPPSRT